MNQDKWKGWVEIVGVVSVVVTLIFVAFEIRHNTNAVRSTVINSISEQSLDTLRLIVQDNTLRDAMRAVDAGTASAAQEDRMFFFYASLMRLQQNRYLQIKLGVVDEEELLLLGGRADIYRRPGFRRYWEVAQERYDPGFREFVERVLISLPAGKEPVPF